MLNLMHSGKSQPWSVITVCPEWGCGDWYARAARVRDYPMILAVVTLYSS